MNVFIAEHPYIFAILVVVALSIVGNTLDNLTRKEADE